MKKSKQYRKHTQDDLLGKLFSDIAKHKPMTRADEKVVALRYKELHNKVDRDTLINTNLRFIIKEVKPWSSYKIPMIDLFQQGALGFLKAVEKYNPDSGNRLCTYASHWIRAYIQNYIVYNWSSVKFGTTQAQRSLFFGLAKARREFIAKYNREASDAELAKMLYLKESEIESISGRLTGRDLSLNTRIGGPDGVDGDEFEGLIVDQDPLPDAKVDALMFNEANTSKLYGALDQLEPRQAAIIKRRFLSNDRESFESIGKDYGVSRERIRQLQTLALNSLSKILRANTTSLDIITNMKESA